MASTCGKVLLHTMNPKLTISRKLSYIFKGVVRTKALAKNYGIKDSTPKRMKSCDFVGIFMLFPTP